VSLPDAPRRGNPRCWLDGYTFEDCCRPEPKVGCWDSEFTPQKCCAEVPPDDADKPVDVTEEEMTAAYFRATTAARDRPLGCEDTPRGLWTTVKIGSAALNVSRRHGMPGDKLAGRDMEEVLRHVLTWVDDQSAWESAKKACPAGALDAIDLSVAHIDREVSEDRARAAYKLHQSLRLELISKNRWPPAGDWPLLSDGFEYVPKLLGLVQRHATMRRHVGLATTRSAAFRKTSTLQSTCRTSPDGRGLTTSSSLAATCYHYAIH